MFYDKAVAEMQRIKRYIDQIKEEIASLPEGKLYCIHDRKRLKWYHKIGNKKYYISQKNRLLAEKLATRRFLSLLLKDYEQEEIALGFYLRHCGKEPGKAAQDYLSNSDYKELIKPHFKPLSRELKEWANEPYDPNPNHPENRIIRTSSGRFVRSKSEALIEMLLMSNHIPFRYEAPTIIGGVTYYPDFTIRHPATGEFFYFEHFGMMDKASYRQNAFQKLEQYAKSGIYIGKNLIATFETSDNPLDSEQVMNLIKQFFL